jgi:hypothetical protein
LKSRSSAWFSASRCRLANASRSRELRQPLRIPRIATSEQRGLDTYLSTSRQEHGKRPRPSRGPAPRDLDARGRMDRKLRSKAGQAIYALRKIIVEPVFGQIKAARGLDRFLLRGLEKVNGEWALMATTHNIGKLHRAAVATA